MQTKVLGIQTMDLSVFGGIIVGIVVYFVHKWAVKVQLPTVIGFFSGPRFVPIATIVIMSAVATGLFFVWPPVQKGISVLSVFILKSGPIGTFLYGLVERALLPFGLHPWSKLASSYNRTRWSLGNWWTTCSWYNQTLT